MASKRILKKSIHKVCGDIATECRIACEVYDDMDKARMAQIIRKVAELQIQALKRVSIVFDKSAIAFGSKQEYTAARRKYFKQSFHANISAFNQGVLDIISEMNATLTPQQKAANVKALAGK